MSKKNYKKKVSLICILFLFVSNGFSEKVFYGRIYSINSGAPIVGANIYNRSLGIGATSDSNGRFDFVRPEKKEFSFSVTHIAYENIDVYVKDKENMQIFMQNVFLQFNDIVVTGTKCEYAISESPVNSEVINSKQIKKSGAMNLSELLNSNIGMSMNYDIHGPFDYNLQGLGPKYVLIVKDGLPIAGKFRDKIDLDQILLGNVNRIEIVKGPGSVMYGSDAMGGVINIITTDKTEDNSLYLNYKRTFLDGNKTDQSKEPVGNFFNLGAKRSLGPIHFRASLSYVDRTDLGIEEPKDHTNISQHDLSLGAKWSSIKRVNELDFNLHHFIQNEDSHNYLIENILLSNNIIKTFRNESSIKLKTVLHENIDMINSLSYSDYGREFNQDGIDSTFIMNNISKENLLDYELNMKLHLPSNKLVVGYEITRPTYKNHRLIDSSQTLLFSGLFLQNEHNFSDKQSLLFGIRKDIYDNSVVYSPRVAYRKRIDKFFNFRASYGKGYRTPSVSERYMDFHNISQGYRVIGNPNLKPEESVGASLMLGYKNINNLSITTSIYHNEFENKIHTIGIQEDTEISTIFQYKNISTAQFSGLEFQTHYAINGSTTIKYNLNLRRNVDGNGNHLLDSVPISFGTIINRKLDSFGLDFEIVYHLNKRHVTNAYFNIVDLNVSRNMSDHLKLRLKIKNITNHTDAYYGPFIGRSISVEAVFDQ